MTETNPYHPPEGEYPLLSSTDKLVRISRHETASEARMLCFRLEQEGVRAAVQNEQSSLSAGMSFFGRIGAVTVDVFVLAADQAKALEIKEKFFSGSQEPSDVPEWICQCGETVDAGFEICWSCGRPYEESE